MTRLVVDPGRRVLLTPDGDVPCLLGRGGIVAAERKREGDGCTPAGAWPIRGALFRPDRAAPPIGLKLPWRWIDRGDGWSDDPADPAYNRPARHPHAFSAEPLWRDDSAYDIVLVLGHNDHPSTPGCGSAIFMHCIASAAWTEGCVAIDRGDLDRLLARLDGRDTLVVGIG